MIQIARAHSYEAVEAVRNELRVVPAFWLEAAYGFKWFILPESLSPLFIGLLIDEAKTHDGRSYSTVGGWCALEETTWLCRETPHIYISSQSYGSVVHELGHALAKIWHTQIDELFKPDRALYPYAASNAEEYFACAVDAFLKPPNDIFFDTNDIHAIDPDICMYLETRR